MSIFNFIKWLHLYARTDRLLSQSNEWLPVNIYSIQTGRINRQILRPCENVNKTFTAHKCRKTNPTGNSASSERMAKYFLTKITAQTKISVLTGPKGMKKRTKSAAREKRFKILLMVKSKKKRTKTVSYETKPKKNKLEILKRYLLVNLTCTLLLHESLLTKWRRAVRFVFDVKKHSALFGPAKVSKEHPEGQ